MEMQKIKRFGDRFVTLRVSSILSLASRFKEEGLTSFDSYHVSLNESLRNARSGCVEMAKLLVDNCGDLDPGRALKIAVARKQIEMVEVFVEKSSAGYAVSALVEAAVQDKLESVMTLLELSDQETIQEALIQIAKAGKIKTTKLVLTKCDPTSYQQTFAYAAENGLVVLELLDDVDTYSINRATTRAAARGYTEVVQMVLDRCESASINFALEAAALEGRVDIVDLLRGQCTPKSISTALEKATASGYDEVVHLLSNKRARMANCCGCDSNSHDSVVDEWLCDIEGFVVPQFLTARTMPLSLSLALVVSRIKNQTVEGLLPWQRKREKARSLRKTTSPTRNSAPVNLFMCLVLPHFAEKILTGMMFRSTQANMALPPLLLAVSVSLPPNLEAIPHVVELINCFLTPITVDAAVYNDLPNVVQKFGKCHPYTVKAMGGAAARGRLGIVQRLHETRSEGCAAVAFTGASAPGHLKYICRQGTRYMVRPALVAAAAKGHVEALNACHGVMPLAYGMEEVSAAATANGRVEVLKVLIDRGYGNEFLLATCLREAVEWGQLGCIELLLPVCARPGLDEALRAAARCGRTDVMKILL
ncbi:unnamed protein product [Phytophthora lilii]|uniref:Unnamed protein product n=1 Tax=Phytophthora lilii TaxID=2077276 RepID=A0A9W6TRM0_9STRA|nr:unnamed protein product [Phytophthora lilii]